MSSVRSFYRKKQKLLKNFNNLSNSESDTECDVTVANSPCGGGGG